MSEAIIALAKSVLPKDDGFRLTPTESEVFMLAQSVLEQAEKIKELQEAVREATKAMEKHEYVQECNGELLREWHKKFGLEKEG